MIKLGLLLSRHRHLYPSLHNAPLHPPDSGSVPPHSFWISSLATHCPHEESILRRNEGGKDETAGEGEQELTVGAGGEGESLMPLQEEGRMKGDMVRATGKVPRTPEKRSQSQTYDEMAILLPRDVIRTLAHASENSDKQVKHAAVIAIAPSDGTLRHMEAPADSSTPASEKSALLPQALGLDSHSSKLLHPVPLASLLESVNAADGAFRPPVPTTERDKDSCWQCDACQYCDDVCDHRDCQECTAKLRKIALTPKGRWHSSAFTKCQVRRHNT